MSEVYKASKKKLARAIKANKERCWREFRATLERDPWERLYVAVMFRMARRRV